MVGRWLGIGKNRVQGTNLLTAVSVPTGAGLLSCRVMDPVNQPVSHAEFTVSDVMGRKVVGGGADPFGSFVATVPAGEYRLGVTAEGYTPLRESATVRENAVTSLGDVALRVAQPPRCPSRGTGRSSRRIPRSGSPRGTSDWHGFMAGSTPSPG